MKCSAPSRQSIRSRFVRNDAVISRARLCMHPSARSCRIPASTMGTPVRPFLPCVEGVSIRPPSVAAWVDSRRGRSCRRPPSPGDGSRASTAGAGTVRRPRAVDGRRDLQRRHEAEVQVRAQARRGVSGEIVVPASYDATPSRAHRWSRRRPAALTGLWQLGRGVRTSARRDRECAGVDRLRRACIRRGRGAPGAARRLRPRPPVWREHSVVVGPGRVQRPGRARRRRREQCAVRCPCRRTRRRDPARAGGHDR